MSLIHFSVERPFGIYLFGILNTLSKTITGTPASNFTFVEGVTRLSTFKEVVVTCLVYYATIFGGQYLMRKFAPFGLKNIFQIHNVLLTLVSGTLLLLLTEQIFPMLVKHGLYHALCKPEAWTQELVIIYYLNYLVKYWELADTIFLVTKKKKLEFLHYFHHSMTLVLCYSQLVGGTTLSWLPIILNLLVHVLMYYYYYRTSLGYKIWWKKYLTSMQIIQFVIDLLVVYACSYTYYAYTFTNGMPNFGNCAGKDLPAVFGCFLLTSYLFLFINFYHATYSIQKEKKSSNSSALRQKVL
ncbi:fatty acid elongase [Spinellus fusiger]|nr:fatty acid elongase [Spinellus fusiger]